MSLALTIADNGDGTATATLVGTFGSSYQVFTSPPNGPWTQTGSGVGDGTCMLTTGGGYFFAYATDATRDITPVTSLFPVTTSAVAVEMALCQAVQADLQSIVASLSPLVSANIQLWKVVTKDDLTNLTLPSIVVAPFGTETTIDGTNVEDDWGKPVAVMCFDRNSKVNANNMGQYLLWRERIEKRYRNKPLAGVSQSLVCTIEPGPIFDFSSIALGLDLLQSGVTLRFRTRETRTP